MDKYVTCEDNKEYEINRNGSVRKRGHHIIYDDYEYYVEPVELLYKNYGKYVGVVMGDKKYAVHRLLAKAFIPNPDNLPHIKFKDGDIHNLSIDNLEWSSYINGNSTREKDSEKYGTTNGKKILCKEDGNIFNSMLSASRYYGINYSTFSYHFANKQNINGKTFVYAPKNVDPNVFAKDF